METEHPLVLVLWDDAADVDGSAWVDKETLEEPDPVVIHQVGYLLSMNSSAVVLTQAISRDQVANRTRIPTGMVRSIVSLTEGTPIPVPKKRKRNGG